jgi:hypothetical protein
MLGQNKSIAFIGCRQLIHSSDSSLSMPKKQQRLNMAEKKIDILLKLKLITNERPAVKIDHFDFLAI